MNSFATLERAYLENLFSRTGQSVHDIPALYQSLPDLNIVDDNECNLYHLAARFCDRQAIAFLAEKGIKPRADQYGNTPLHAVLKTPYLNDYQKVEVKADDIYQTTKQLLAMNVNPKKKNNDGDSAIFEGGVRLLNPFMQALADENVRLDVVGEENKNLLHLLAYRIRKDDNSQKRECAIKVIKILLKSGSIDPEDKDIFDTTPLVYAQRNGINEIIALFTGEEGADGGMTLAQAVLYKNLPALEGIIAKGDDLNQVFDEYGKTALMLACEYPSLECVNILVKAGADINFKTGNDDTAVNFLITRALYNLHVGAELITKILRVLVDNGLAVNDSVDKLGNTALNLLCQQRDLSGQNYNMAEELIDAQCDINQANLDGLTPLMAYAQFGNENQHAIAELLLDNEANGNLIDKAGVTGLMYCAINSDKASAVRIAKLLLEHDDIEINKVNNQSETALDLAVQHNNEMLVKLILAKL